MAEEELTEASLNDRKVTELRDECKRLGLKTTGKKKELIDRHAILFK